MSSSDRTVDRREIEDSTAARLAEIVAAAEKAAQGVIDEAEAEARTRLVDARVEADRIVAERLAGLARLTDEIAAQAEALRGQSEALQQALSAAKSELEGVASQAGPASAGRRDADRDAGGGSEPGPAGLGGPALTVVGGQTPGGAAPGPDGGAGEGGGAPGSEDPATPAGARLLATQMAVSGSSRAEIEARLRDGFAIGDPGSILDAILGPGS